MQLATVCKTFAQAAQTTPLHLSLYDIRDIPPSTERLGFLSSGLLCSWATSLITISANLDICLDIGLVEFVAASRQLKYLDLSCSSPAAAELANRLLAAAHSTQVLEYCGVIFPHVLPSRLQSLELHSGTDLDGNQTAILPDGFTEHLASLSHLTRLSLRLGDSAKLCGSATTLQPLEIELCFSVSDEFPVQLEWLTAQTYTELSITAQVFTDRPSQHQAVVHNLQQLWEADVFITLGVPFCESLQQIWAKLTGKQSLKLELMWQMGMAPVLKLLPQGHSLYVEVYGLQQILWAALPSDAHDTEFLLFGGSQLHFLGCPVPVIGSDGPPGLLHITCLHPGQVRGLQPPCFGNAMGHVAHDISISKTNAAAARRRALIHGSSS